MAFKDYLLEQEKKKTVAVLFGRMNPPTSGHEENVEGLKKLANQHDGDHLVIASHSHDAKKNPLTPEQKIKHLKRAFPNTNITSSSKEKPTLFHHLSDLHKKGYTHVVLAGGSDRAEELHRLKDYNGKEGKHGYYNFKSITTQSTGERKQGVSGTDMRKHATSNDFTSFRKGLPSKLAANEGHAKEVFSDVRRGMGLHESLLHNLVNKIREDYVAGKIFKIGQLIETKDGKLGKVTYRGSNYVTIQEESGRVFKAWLDDVTEVNSKTSFITQVKIKEQKIPMLLMTREQREKLFEAAQELEFDGIQTKNLHMCKDAFMLFRDMISTIRSGKHIGEITAHDVAIKTTSTGSATVKSSEAQAAMKSPTVRSMQFKNYMGL